ncbi:DivIVA domain-containing protein [Hymenobacter sp. 15J16-1T3B]|uniref:DivIVA domain-containing protein n=1 Tax=Hymenobacter sp. 15J16-1T3B TaxID=2886941 RepID=UPI001D10CA3B|nr:DivIVA domain-containing protein [Hymenobacter sp. 15J16-1T3B]MCC3157238.1 DivIVA domain-containing protein [Hymenobacter sp. 15J16-1T3B]
MKITALDIRQKTFERAFRGVDKDEVDGFLLTLSQQWERMTDENRELRRQLDQAQQDVQRMREVETSLYRTLKTAEDTSTSIVDQAQKSAELKLREAQMEAERLLAEARQKARTVVEDAYRQAEKTVADMQREVQGLGQDHQRLENVYDGLVRDLQQLAGAVQEKASKAQQRQRTAVGAILSRAASVKVTREEPASPATEPAMYVPAPSASSAAAIPATAPVAGGGFGADAPRSIGFEPNGPQPGKQPQPGAPSHPEISPREPYENPGVAEPGRIHQPEPATVPNPVEPRIEPTQPDIQPVGPPSPEIAPQPSPHPGFAAAPAVAAETEKSFFDEI